MGQLGTLYRRFEKIIMKSLENNNIKHRPKASSGLWLGTLMGISAMATLLKEDGSYSEICLLVGLTGFGLIISCLCLYIRLLKENVPVKDFQLVYFLPAISLSMLYLFIGNKGLLVSVSWGLSVGTLSTWGVLQLMSNFPGSFTIGEATTVMHGATLFLISVVTNLPLRYHLPPIHSNDITTVILQVGMSFVLSFCLLCGYFPILHAAKYFYSLLLGTLLLVVVPMLYILIDQNPITWILTFLFTKKSRVAIIVYWATCVLLAIIVINRQILSNSQATTAARKYFHVLAAFVYIPGLLYDLKLLYLASGATMGLLIMLELLRLLRMPPLGHILQEGFSVFVDEKDNVVSLTALYLLSGLSFPLWMPTTNVTLPVRLCGVLAVGIGDTVASFFGSKWGKHKWHGSEKSIEGTVACITSQLLFICSFMYTGYIKSSWLLFKSIVAIIVVSLVEAKTDQIDNLALPLLMYVCLLV